MTILLSLLLALGPARAMPDTTGCVAPDSALRGVLETSAEYWGTVGQQTVIVRDGRLVVEDVRGKADMEDGAPVTPETRFFVASVTKAFTGVALLRRAETGRIDLDAPIQRYVPEFPAPPGPSITPRLLAAHLAGIRHYRPGASYGYDLLATAMQAAAGESFRKLIAELILEPLDLARTRFDDVRAVISGRARGYTRYYPWFTRDEVDTWLRAPGFDYSYNPGGGGLLSTAEDLARFGDAVTTPGFLSEASRKLLFVRQSAEVESPWSYGWIVQTAEGGRTQLRIMGSDPGFQATILHDPEARITVAQVENSWPARPSAPPPYPDPLARLAALCRGEGFRPR